MSSSRPLTSCVHEHQTVPVSRRKNYRSLPKIETRPSRCVAQPGITSHHFTLAAVASAERRPAGEHYRKRSEATPYRHQQCRLSDDPICRQPVHHRYCHRHHETDSEPSSLEAQLWPLHVGLGDGSEAGYEPRQKPPGHPVRPSALRNATLAPRP